MNFEFVNDQTRERLWVSKEAEVHSLSVGGGSMFYHRCGHKDGLHFEFIFDEPDDVSVLISDCVSWIFMNEFDWERLADRMKEEGLKVERYKPEPEENISD